MSLVIIKAPAEKKKTLCYLLHVKIEPILRQLNSIKMIDSWADPFLQTSKRVIPNGDFMMNLFYPYSLNAVFGGLRLH